MIKFKAKIEIIGVNPFVFLPERVLHKVFVQARKDKGKIPVKTGHNKLLIPTTELKSVPGEIFSLTLFSSVTVLPEIRFKQFSPSKK